jgi:glutathione synthase/RimK-type ligase-like ATP-grasp enzyme
MRIAFLTCAALPDLWDDDRLAAEELSRRGHTVEPLVWNAEGTFERLEGFDLAVVRNPWDWFHHRAAFRAFLERLRAVGPRVVNTPSTLVAFADKSYLARLGAKGLRVVPTVELGVAELAPRLETVLAEQGWSRAVLKPAFTANAVGAQVFDAGDVARALEAAARVPLEPGETWLLQPFIPSIAAGEQSFLFFGGAFSHAVRKRPKPGDWRVQHEYGGSSEPFDPPRAAVEEATQLLLGAAPGTTYARVDAVEVNGRLHLMELEVVEPELFFRHHPLAAARFADALLSAG